MVKKIISFALLLAVIFVGYMFFHTYRAENSESQKLFLTGKFPSPLPDGFYKGTTEISQKGWEGKTFFSTRSTGINTFQGEQKFPFVTSQGKGLTDPELEVVKIDYKNGKNPFWVAPVLDEIVQVAPGKYVGKIHYRLIPGFPFVLGYFQLEK